MKYLISILLILFVSCGNADEVEKEQVGEMEIFKGGRSMTKLPQKRVDEKECFKAIKNGTEIDKRITPFHIPDSIIDDQIQIETIYNNKFYTTLISRYKPSRSFTSMVEFIYCYVWENKDPVKK